MKKRWLALCLATVMAASLTACGQDVCAGYNGNRDGCGRQ